MDYHIRGSPFKNQFVVCVPPYSWSFRYPGSYHLQIPSTPTPNIPTCLTSTGLQALPYISLLVGVDELIPTKAVYALYDGSIACLRFVHGDGLFIGAERVCFRNTFKDGVPNLNRNQRLHFIELMNKSMKYYHLITQDGEFKATVARQFPTASSVSQHPMGMWHLRLTFFRSKKVWLSCVISNKIPAQLWLNFYLQKFQALTRNSKIKPCHVSPSPLAQSGISARRVSKHSQPTKWISSSRGSTETISISIAPKSFQ